MPSLSVKEIKAKVDTGARTSALHVSNLRIEKVGSIRFAVFQIHPKQHSSKPSQKCRAKILEFRKIKSSSGHESLRPVISVEMKLGDMVWTSEVTLVNRDMMGFRMLLGREAVRNRFLVDVGRSFMFMEKKKAVRKK